jgi:hypothetical protein
MINYVPYSLAPRHPFSPSRLIVAVRSNLNRPVILSLSDEDRRTIRARRVPHLKLKT